MTKRELVYNKFGGLCAYTGKPLGDDWQIDHMTSKKRHWYNTVQATPHTGTIEEYKEDFENRLKDCDNTDNLLPALRIVNHYKRFLDLEEFRSRMINFHKKLSKLPKNPVNKRSVRRKEYMYQVADAFGITPEKPFSGKFYFETKKLFTEEKIMREIKFRGKRVSDKIWVYGSYTAMREDDRNNPFRSDIPKTYHRIWQYEPGDWNMGGYANYEIIPETVCQFTGLKDKNGVEIYEGDILKWRCSKSGSENVENYVVDIYFGSHGWNIAINEDGERWATGKSYWTDSDREVIGNIHDNPELL